MNGSRINKQQFINWILWLSGKRRRIKIKGPSMLPLFQNGDVVYVNPNAYKQQFPQVDDIVVVRHPYKKYQLIKRVVSIDKKNQLFLVGFNQQSCLDSRLFGAVPCHYIKGKVVGFAKRSKRKATG